MNDELLDVDSDLLWRLSQRLIFIISHSSFIILHSSFIIF